MTERPAKKATATKKAAPRRNAPLRDVVDVDLPGDPPINEQQMRQLHALLRTRVGFTDRADILDWLSVMLGRDITSRKELTHPEALQVIEHLGHLPMAPATDDQWAALRAEFPPGEVGKLPRSTCKECSDSQSKRCERHRWVSRCSLCNNSHSEATMHIDYVGHADVTARLLSVDPTWTYEVLTVDGMGAPMLDRNDGLWINLTILGVTRPGYGACDPGSHQKGGDRVKVAIGDALRNAAMRFGVALDLWAKGDRAWATAPKDVPEPAPDEPAPPQDTAPEWRGKPKGLLLLAIDDLASGMGMTREQITAKWRAENGDLSMDDFNTRVGPATLDALVRSYEAYAATMAPSGG